MYLKKMEIYGFKSFADKTELDFKRGITAIVGPNGSGKSNISDAIKWVLGEQKIKSLRGTKMEDVIFAGTLIRKPLGYAEVTLVIDNSEGMLNLDYSEISVTRRIFRSGESEYLINKNQCRLKDVQELFADTGLGKEGYSIIGQGKIDSIVSSNPQDIRNLFDEAAGIVKFKNRKAESERKLDRTVDNLHRITDIIAELEKQLVPLKRQKEKAKRYIVLAEELKKIDLNVFVYKMDKIKSELHILTNDREDVEANQKAKLEQIDEKDEIYQRLKIKLAGIDDGIDDNSRKMIDLSENTEKFNTDIQVASANILNSENQIKRIFSEITDLEKNLSEIAIRKKDIEEDNGANIANINHLEETLENLSSKRTQLEKCIMANKAKNVTFENEKKELRDMILRLNNDVSILENNISIREKQIEKYSTDMEELSSSLEKIKMELEVNGSNIGNVMPVLKKDQSNLQELSLLMDAKEKEKEELLSQKSLYLNNLSVSKSKLHMLEDEKDLKGYYKSVKNLLDLKLKDAALKDTLHDIVGNLFSVDEKYSIAIETALGSTFQNIVVSDESTAKKCIGILNKNNWGRATFLPLNIIDKNTTRNQEVKVDDPGFIDLGVNLVSFIDKYKGVLSNLLGRVLIVSDMDSAVRISQKTNYRHKIVTLQGEVFFPGGAIVGGSQNKNNLLLQRKNNINSLKGEIDAYIEKIKEFDIQLGDNKQSFDSVRIKMAEAASLMNENVLKHRLLEQKSTDLKSQMDKIQRDLEKAGQEININKVKISEESARIGEKKAEAESLGTKLGSMAPEINDESEVEFQRELNEVLRDFSEIMIEKAKLTEKMYSADERLGDFIRESENINQKIRAKNEEAEYLQGEIEKLTSESLEKQSFMSVSSSEKSKIQTALDELKIQRDLYNKKFDALENDLKALNHENMLISESMGKLDLKINSLNIEKEYLSENIYETYQMNYLMAREYSYPVDNMQFEVQKVKELKDKIKGLGNINVASIEQYDEVKERFEFLSTQKEDLLKAREELKGLIKDISKDIQRQFVEQFELIQTKFNETFSMLFNGGSAGLIILDNEDIMETGIEIVAQPPGKKLKSITLLSGGEKALTAIALLFSIISIKPAPFCVLDEIDAALDDSNVDRFAGFLSMITKDNQFITITHRKGTMEIADRMFGITMGKDGVSKMLSVQISDIMKEAN